MNHSGGSAAPERCRICETVALSAANKSGLCRCCYAQLPPMAKAAGATAVKPMLQSTVAAFVDRFGEAQAARLLEVEPPMLAALIASAFKLTACDATDVGDVRKGQAPALAPLRPETSRLVAPWRRPLRLEAASQGPAEMNRRYRLKGERARRILYVPDPGASDTPVTIGNIYGRTSPRGRPRKLPLRVAAGLWSMGFSNQAIVRIAARVGVVVCARTIRRGIGQVLSPFDGAERIRAAELAAETGLRPLVVATDVDPPGTRMS